MPYGFVQVDTFTHRPLYGNPAAIVFNADNLASATMQKIAREMNLSETVFILSSKDDQVDYCEPPILADTPPQIISTGAPWLIVELTSLAALSALNPTRI
ncbi:MAG: PhzF family phenazine biosynthesis protein [Parahaliea sp.]